MKNLRLKKWIIKREIAFYLRAAKIILWAIRHHKVKIILANYKQVLTGV